MTAGIILGGDTYPHCIVEDLKAERQQSIDSVMVLKRQTQQFNNDRGYDLITLPGNTTNCVFYKERSQH